MEALQHTGYLEDCHFLLATDVCNPLCGPSGATYVFARQKGADEAMLPLLEQRNAEYGRLLSEQCGCDVALLEGAGAAGGAGAALLSMPHCRRVSGIDLMLQLYPDAARLQEAWLVFTGEGCIDAQTLMGKAPYGVALEAQRYGVPCIALGGRVRLTDEERQSSPWSDIIEVTPPDMEDSVALQPAVARRNIYETVKNVISAQINVRP